MSHLDSKADLVPMCGYIRMCREEDSGHSEVLALIFCTSSCYIPGNKFCFTLNIRVRAQ